MVNTKSLNLWLNGRSINEAYVEKTIKENTGGGKKSFKRSETLSSPSLLSSAITGKRSVCGSRHSFTPTQRERCEIEDTTAS